MNIYLRALITGTFILLNTKSIQAQQACISGLITADQVPKEQASIRLNNTAYQSITDSQGRYRLCAIPPGRYQVQVSAKGYKSISRKLVLQAADTLRLDLDLEKEGQTLEDVVVTGTLKEVSRLSSPVPVEVYTPAFFKKNPTPNIFEALQNVNGVRPQINCNVCNTGDIHINGLEGPYTMVLIDGMPIVSSLSTVYGLSGIPNAIVERIEVVKGPASSLYGSEAVGGLINIITKNPGGQTPKWSADLMGTSWGEYNADLALSTKVGKQAAVLTGVNYFNYQNPQDHNKDNFTDVTLQDRISVFQKWNFKRKEARFFSLAGRYLYEDRWGGEMNWNKSFRGGDSVYGESIYTKRWELLGKYQLPTRERLMLSFSYNNHNQNSVYGKTIYQAQQNISFGQLVWDKKWQQHDWLVGAALRYTYYDDNTPATAGIGQQSNNPSKTWLPGIFIQDEITFNPMHKLLLGFRYDYNSLHGNIFTPRIAYKWTVNQNNTIRLNAGTGFRVVNLFTEEHAALTGARSVEVKNDLNPERSYNINLNYNKRFFLESGTFMGFDFAAFYTFFNNRIVPDYETDPNKIIYDNLNGYAQSKGISLNADIAWNNGLKLLAGGTLMSNTITENHSTMQQMLTEKFTATWALSYTIKPLKLVIDYTGNVYSPMRLPLLGKTDPRSAYSPWWSLQNIQFTYKGFKQFEIYAGIKNLLNWTPGKRSDFIIARSEDPFDKKVHFDAHGNALITPDNPYGLTFDPSYVYAPNQGIRGFIGLRMSF
ncbi:TonB-dependent receptor [Taibaiella sp. KBW10]|uniref:TonB-dependent receptor n=1 Tax=Taibaiella sp. KBW10 TaxID=2153357 RepID=UPI000F59EE84|nr:TonB-dependent receptor [Taibaiella sp. KBW10]RQO29922.1 TonB-dependent receptor [Taibaiella sp. KBW10]